MYDHPPDNPPPWLGAIHLEDTSFYDPGGTVSAARATTAFLDRMTRRFQNILG